MKKYSKNKHHELSELNITPLLDLCFVLLVIFILTTAPPVSVKSRTSSRSLSVSSIARSMTLRSSRMLPGHP